MVLGKKKMLNLINELLEKNYKLKDCEYKKYRESEWLDFEDLHIFKGHKNHILLDFLTYNEEEDCNISINTISYQFDGEKWVKIYDRNQMIQRRKTNEI